MELKISLRYALFLPLKWHFAFSKGLKMIIIGYFVSVMFSTEPHDLSSLTQ